ncbi:hypothetical protein [Flavobacterium sp.]|uniref:hypothetical protein n=1 Tax=Flavobacterium sp. TaxID=239 RepID=UPI00391C9250
MNYKTIFSLLTLIGILTACKSYKIKVYSLNRNIEYIETNGVKKPYATNPNKSIVFISDSTVNYTKIYGGLGTSTTIQYRISNDTLILKSHDIYGKNLNENNPDFSYLYLINNDSLTSLQNNEKYYSDTYKKRIYKKPIGFYIVYENKAYKINSQKNADQIYRKIKNVDNERFIELDKDIAKKRYGINRKYKTLVYK